MKKILLVLVLFLTSCSSHQNRFITQHQDAWIEGDAEAGGVDKGLLFCRANLKADGSADPICYEAGFVRYDDLKSSKK